MTTTRATTLVGLFVLGVAVLFVTEGTLVRLGEPQFIPPITLGVALVFIGVILPVLAWPIRKVTRHKRSDATKNPAIYAGYLYRILPVVPIRSSTLLVK